MSAARFAPGGAIAAVPSIRKDVRDVAPSDLEGFDAVIHLAALSNDPLSDLNPEITYDVNHRASVRLADHGEAGRRRALPARVVLQQLRPGRRRR